jgi:hypothetical protein
MFLIWPLPGNFAVNYDVCLMTRIQKMSLDYHFKVEQESGSSMHAFFGFNGKRFNQKQSYEFSTVSFLEHAGEMRNNILIRKVFNCIWLKLLQERLVCGGYQLLLKQEGGRIAPLWKTWTWLYERVSRDGNSCMLVI